MSERKIEKFAAGDVTLYCADNRQIRELLTADALISENQTGVDTGNFVFRRKLV